MTVVEVPDAGGAVLLLDFADLAPLEVVPFQTRLTVTSPYMMFGYLRESHFLASTMAIRLGFGRGWGSDAVAGRLSDPEASAETDPAWTISMAEVFRLYWRMRGLDIRATARRPRERSHSRTLAVGC